MTPEEQYAEKIDKAREDGQISENQWNDLDVVGENLFDGHGNINRNHQVALDAAFRAAVNDY